MRKGTGPRAGREMLVDVFKYHREPRVNGYSYTGRLHTADHQLDHFRFVVGKGVIQSSE